MGHSRANSFMMFQADLQRTRDQYERENEMKRHRPLRIMEYKAMPSVPGTEKSCYSGAVGCIFISLVIMILLYLFVSWLVGIVVLTNWLIC